jgi:hypothetical protein
LDHKLQIGGKPRVLVLADVPHLTPLQQKSIAQFLARGGSVLVMPGRRVRDGALYNEQLFEGGKGWLPARLEKVAGSTQQPERASAPDVKGSHHPALELFRSKGGLGEVRLPRWWRVQPGPGAATAALLTSGDPLLVEKAHGSGRVLLCAAPPDGAWDSNFPRSWEYPVLMHQLVYYLASPDTLAFHVAPGQPLRYSPDLLAGAAVSLPAAVKLKRPDGATRVFTVDRWPFLYDDTQDPGVYGIQTERHAPVFFVVEPDPRESDLTPLSEQDLQEIARQVPLRFEDDPAEIGLAALDPAHQEDLWWLLLLGVVALLAAELWVSRRLATEYGG